VDEAFYRSLVMRARGRLIILLPRETLHVLEEPFWKRIANACIAPVEILH
jgi:hypothetical protein